jgi:hypothetical protein
MKTTVTIYGGGEALEVPIKLVRDTMTLTLLALGDTGLLACAKGTGEKLGLIPLDEAKAAGLAYGHSAEASRNRPGEVTL